MEGTIDRLLSTSLGVKMCFGQLCLECLDLCLAVGQCHLHRFQPPYQLAAFLHSQQYHIHSNTFTSLQGLALLSGHPLLHTHIHILRFNGHFPGEPGLSSCPLNSPSPYIPELHILLGQA